MYASFQLHIKPQQFAFYFLLLETFLRQVLPTASRFQTGTLQPEKLCKICRKPRQNLDWSVLFCV